MYQLGEAQRQEVARHFWGVFTRENEMIEVVQRIAESAHADGCREIVERAADILVDAHESRTYDYGDLQKFAAKIRALAEPSQVKEAPMFDVRSLTPEEAKDLGNFYKSVYKPIAQPSDAAAREIIAEALWNSEREKPNDAKWPGPPESHRQPYCQWAYKTADVVLAALRSTKRKV